MTALVWLLIVGAVGGALMVAIAVHEAANRAEVAAAEWAAYRLATASWAPREQFQPVRTVIRYTKRKQPGVARNRAPEVVRIAKLKQRRKRMESRRRAQAAEQARFMDVFKLTPEDYAPHWGG